MSVDTLSPRLLTLVMTPEERKAALKPSVNAAQQFLDSPTGQLLDMSTPVIAQSNIDAIGSNMQKNRHNFESISGYEFGFKIAKKKGLLKFKSDSQEPQTPAPVAAAPVVKKEKVVPQPTPVVVTPAEEILKPSAEFMIQAHETLQNFMFSPAAKEVVLDGPAMESIINILLKSNLPPTQQGLQTAYEAAKAQGLLVIRVDHAAIARAAEAKRIADAKAVADAEAHAKEHRLDWLTLNWLQDASTGEVKDLINADAEAKAKIESLWNGTYTAAEEKVKQARQDRFQQKDFQMESELPSSRRNHANFESSEEREAKRTATLKEVENARIAREAAIKEFEDSHHTLGENDSWGRPLPKAQIELVRSTWSKETQNAWAKIDDKYRVLRAYTENNDGRFMDSNGRINHARVEDARRGKGPKEEVVNDAVNALPINATEAQLRKSTPAQIKNYIARRQAAGLN